MKKLSDFSEYKFQVVPKDLTNKREIVSNVTEKVESASPPIVENKEERK